MFHADTALGSVSLFLTIASTESVNEAIVQYAYHVVFYLFYKEHQRNHTYTHTNTSTVKCEYCRWCNTEKINLASATNVYRCVCVCRWEVFQCHFTEFSTLKSCGVNSFRINAPGTLFSMATADLWCMLNAMLNDDCWCHNTSKSQPIQMNHIVIGFKRLVVSAMTTETWRKQRSKSELKSKTFFEILKQKLQ